MEKVEDGIYKTVLKNGKERFHVYWRDGGKQLHRVARSKTQARQMRAQGRVNQMDGATTSPRRGLHVVDALEAFHEDFKSNSGRAPNTVELYRTAIDVRFKNDPIANRPLAAVTPIEIEEAVTRWRNDKRQPAGDGAIRQALTALSKTYKFAIKKRWATSNPVTEVERPKPPPKTNRSFSNDEMKRLLKHLPTDRDRAIVLTLVSTGMRGGELFALKIEDVSHDGLHVTGSLRNDGSIGPPKGKKARVVHLGEVARQSVQTLIGGRESGFVIEARNGKPTNLKNWKARAFNKARVAANITWEGATVHALRHTYATQAIQQGASVILVQNQLGHAKPSITLDVYNDQFISRDSDLTDRIDQRQREFLVH